MLRTLIALLVLGVCGSAVAQVATYADVKAKGGAQLSTAELNQLMPDANVVSRTQAGSTRTRHNRTDGTFTASSDGRGVSGGRQGYATGAGTWKVNDKGQWCVTIQWPRSPDDWCRYMFKVGDKYYGVSSLDDGAMAIEFELSK